MDKKKRNIIIAVLVLVLVIFGIYFIFNSKNENKETTLNTQNDETVDLPVNNSGDSQILDSTGQIDSTAKPTIEEVNVQKREATVKAMALSFTERIGSYSNQSNFENILELKPFMTQKMLTWADDFINSQGDSDNSEYFGVTTRVLSTKIISLDYDAGLADLELNTQRVESRGTQLDNKIKIQKAKASLVKKDDKWFIDSLNWL